MEKPLSILAKLLLIGAGGLAVVAGPVLFLFPGQTASYFAWAIKNPLTPVFMGANYFGGIGAIWAMRTNRWSVARVLMPGIFVFGVSQLLATSLHLPIFNWSHPVAWAWLFVYLTSPVVVVIVYIQMEHHYLPTRPFRYLPPVFRPVTLAFATISCIVGLALWFWPFLFPVDPVAGAVPWWAWSLTPLTARVIGGWYLASTALFVVLSRPHPPLAVRVGVFGVIFATGLEVLGALLHRTAFNGPILAIVLYMLNAAIVFTFVILTFLQWTKISTRLEPSAV